MLIAKILYKSFYWKIFQFLASLIINIIFVRALRSSLSAELYSLSYLLALATSFFTLGLDISLNFYLSRKLISPAMARRIALAVVALALLVSLPLVGLLYRPLSYPGISPQKILLFAALNIAGNLLTVLSGAIFTAGGRNFLPVRISFQVNCLVILLSLLSSMVFSGSRLAEMLFWIYFSASLLQGLFLFVGSRRYDPPTANANTNIAPTADPSTAANTNTGSLALLPAILRFSLAAFIANFIFFAASRTGLYLLPYRAEPSSLGNYIQAFKIVEYMTTLAAFIYYPFMALVASENKEKMNGMVLFMVRLSNTFVLIAAILLLVTGRFLFP
ncbi:MAG TPA: hypothetical protein VE035_11900, partial [Puia sp.]|nr:hypothetical protein [Puia sp.]